MHPAGGPWNPSAPLRSSPLLSSSHPAVFEEKHISALDASTGRKYLAQCSRIRGVLLLNVLLEMHFCDQVSHHLFPFPSPPFLPPPGLSSLLLALAAQFGQVTPGKRSLNPPLGPSLHPDAPEVALASGSNGACRRVSAHRACSADPRRYGVQEAPWRASRHTPHHPGCHLSSPAWVRRQGAG